MVEDVRSQKSYTHSNTHTYTHIHTHSHSHSHPHSQLLLALPVVEDVRSQKKLHTHNLTHIFTAPAAANPASGGRAQPRELHTHTHTFSHTLTAPAAAGTASSGRVQPRELQTHTHTHTVSHTHIHSTSCCWPCQWWTCAAKKATHTHTHTHTFSHTHSQHQLLLALPAVDVRSQGSWDADCCWTAWVTTVTLSSR